MTRVPPRSLAAAPAVDEVGATFEAVYRDEAVELARVAYLLLGSRASAEEVVQDAFVKLHLRWGRVTNPGGFRRRRAGVVGSGLAATVGLVGV